MTALSKYQRLESPGLWRDSPGARRREVIVGLREATLLLSDPRSEMPLAQWSLPAVQRLNPGALPALYAPGEDGDEDLEITDAEMIGALDTVHRALERRKPHPGRLRGAVLGATALAVVGLMVFWLPQQLRSYAAAVLPPPTREALGDLALADLARLTGQPCRSVTGRRAATELASRLLPDAPPRIEVLRDGLATPAHLPGGIILLPAALVQAGDSPELVAGHVLDEALRAAAATARGQDPVHDVLDHMGLAATLRLIATGTASPEALAGFGEAFLARPRNASPPAEALIAAFREAGLATALYAEAMRGTDSPVADLVAGDPFPGGAPTAVLPDESWLELQAICND